MPTIDLGLCDCCSCSTTCDTLYPEAFVISLENPIYRSETLGAGYSPEVFAAARNALTEASYIATLTGQGRYEHFYPVRCDQPFPQPSCEAGYICTEVGRQHYRNNTSNVTGGQLTVFYDTSCVNDVSSARVRVAFAARPPSSLNIDQPYTPAEYALECTQGLWRYYLSGLTPSPSSIIGYGSLSEYIYEESFSDCSVTQPRVPGLLEIPSAPCSLFVSNLMIEEAGGERLPPGTIGAQIEIESLAITITSQALPP